MHVWYFFSHFGFCVVIYVSVHLDIKQYSVFESQDEQEESFGITDWAVDSIFSKILDLQSKHSLLTHKLSAWRVRGLFPLCSTFNQTICAFRGWIPTGAHQFQTLHLSNTGLFFLQVWYSCTVCPSIYHFVCLISNTTVWIWPCHKHMTCSDWTDNWIA